MPTCNPQRQDFRIFWDNAYCVHDLYPNAPAVTARNILSACANAGHPDMVYEFCSAAVSFPGAGISGDGGKFRQPDRHAQSVSLPPSAPISSTSCARHVFPQ